MVTLSTATDIVRLDKVPGVRSSLIVPDPGIPLASTYRVAKISPEKAWKTQPSVRKVVGFIARNVASVPAKVFKRAADGDRQRMAGSAAEKAFQQPTRFRSGFKLMERITIDKLLYDRWCVVLIDGVMHRVPPRMLVIESNALDEITFVGANIADRTIDLTELPIALGTGWDAWSGDGLSPLETLTAILEEQANAVEWRRRLWDEAPKFSGIIKRPANAPKWEEGQRTRFVESFRAFRDGNAGGTPIFEDGMEWQDWRDKVNPADAEDIAGRKLTDAEVASAFYVPPELVGAREGTFSNIAAFRQMLFGPTLGPHFEEFEQAFNAEIIPALTNGKHYVEFDRGAAINGSLLEQAKVLSTAVGGPWMTRAEARALQNLPHIDGADELVVPLNVAEGGQASPQDGGEGRPEDDG